jgi:hypothetical protein
MAYYEASAKKGTCIESMFDEVAQKLYEKFKKPAKHFRPLSKVDIRTPIEITKKSRCC